MKQESGVVKTVGKGEGSPASSLAAASCPRERVARNSAGVVAARRFCESGGDKYSAVIVRTADENFFPRLRMSRREIMAVGEFIDFFRRQFAKTISSPAR